MPELTKDSTSYYTYDKGRSFTSKILFPIFRIAGIKKSIQKSLKKSPVNHRSAELPKSFHKIFNIEEHKIDGKTIWTISAKVNKTDKTILYLHGGAYVYGIQNVYWTFIKELVLTTNATVVIPDYPLIPEQTALEVYSFLEKTYEWLTAKTNLNNLILVGDSAGAGLGLGFTQKLQNENKPLPSQLILLSPWLDVSLTNPDIIPIDKNDPQLGIKDLQLAGKIYADKWGTTDYKVSPIYGQFDDLPKMSIFISTYDILYADTEKLKRQLVEQGIIFNYFVYPKLFHDWAVILPTTKEGKKVLDQVQRLINE